MIENCLEALKRHQSALLWAVGLFCAALLVRLPYLYEIPRFTDEVLEWKLAFEIAQGTSPLWENVQPYFGPFQPALLAVALYLFPSPYVPRALTLIIGALTVPATFGLGSVVGGWRSGIIAALLMLTSSTHIVATSHVAYINSFTPLLVTFALTLLYLARQRDRGHCLIAAGIVFGLSAHTHPIVLTLLPGLALWFIFPKTQWRWFRRPSFYLAVCAALIAYSPVLVNILFHFTEFTDAVVAHKYAFAPARSFADYWANLQGLGIEFGRMLGAVYPNFAALRDYFFQPLIAAYVLVLLLTLAAMVRLRNSFFITALVSPLVFIPYFNTQYGDFPYFTRYLAFLLPLTYAAIGLGLSAWWQYLEERFAKRTGTNHARAHWLVRGMLLLGIGWLVFYPLALTNRFYESQIRGNRTNVALLNTIARVEATSLKRVWLDPELRAGEFPSGGNALFALQVWFELTGRIVRQSRPAALCRRGDGLLIATPTFAAATLKECAIELVAQESIATRPGFDPLFFNLYRVP